jgi:hypothetical protein
MQSILTWMHSVSTTGALVPIPATTSYLPRGIGHEKSKSTSGDSALQNSWEGNGISFYTPAPSTAQRSSHPSRQDSDASSSTQQQQQRVSFASLRVNSDAPSQIPPPPSSSASSLSVVSAQRKHQIPFEDEGKTIFKRRLLETMITGAAPTVTNTSATDSLCTEDQSLPDDDSLLEEEEEEEDDRACVL